MPQSVYEYLVPFLPCIGIVGKDINTKFSFSVFIEKMAVPIIIAVITAFIATDRLSHVLEERMTNHTGDSNIHMEYRDKVKIFVTDERFREYKRIAEDKKETIQDLIIQLNSINKMLHERIVEMVESEG